MLEKIGRVRLYQQNLRRGWITFEDTTQDLPIFYNTLKLNGIEYLKAGQKVFVAIDKSGKDLRIKKIELLKNKDSKED